jgi:hypothetical protein
MGKVIVHEQITVNGAFDSPSPETWLELDTDSSDAALVSGCGELAHTLTTRSSPPPDTAPASWLRYRPAAS